MTSWSFAFSAHCLVRQWLWEMTSWSFSYSAQCLVRQWLWEMTSRKWSYSAQCLVRQWLWEMTSWKWSYSAQCLVRHWIHGAASLRCHSTGAALGQGCLALNQRCITVEVPPVAVPLQGRQHPRRCAETGSHGLTVQQTTEISCCGTLTRRSTIWLCIPAGSSGAVVEKTVQIPQLQRRCWTLLLTCLSLRNDRCRGWSRQCSKLWRLRSWRSSTGLAFLGPCTQVHGHV